MALLVYTLLRVALVIVVGGVLYLVGMRGLLLVAVAVVVGAMLSYLLLPTQRRQAAGALQTIAERDPRPVARDADAVAEDEALDALDRDDSTDPANAPATPPTGSAEGEHEADRRPEG